MNRQLMYKILCLTLIVFSLSSCQRILPGNNSNSEPVEQQELQPIVLDVYYSDTDKYFDREIEQYIDPETIEKVFDFYGFYDISTSRYRLITADKQYDFKVEGNKLLGSGVELTAKLEGDKLYLQYQDLVDFFAKTENMKSISSDSLRLTFKEGASLEQASLNGTAFRDYNRIESQTFENEAVEIINIAEGFALIIADNQPYLTSEANLVVQPKKIDNNELNLSEHKKVFLWDLYGNDSKAKIASTVDVVLPKWLALKDESGRISTNYNKDYVANVIGQDAEIWALVNNSFDPDLTSTVLNSQQARDNFNQQLLAYCQEHRLSGINVDFENMKLEDSDAFVQLLAELSLLTKENNIELSACVTVPDGSDNWSRVYDRRRMAKLLDYVMLMAYDQHYAASPVAGPVAAYNWVEENIHKTLTMIPAGKLVLGVPFYTRLWYETIDDKRPNHAAVTSKSIFMPSALNIINTKNPTRVWDEKSKQNYYAYFDNNQIVKFWYEGPVSVGLKTELAQKYNLSGVAYWALGFETEETWDEIKAKVGQK